MTSSLVVGGSAHRFEHLFDLVEEDAAAEFNELDDWEQVLTTLEAETEDDDCIVTRSLCRDDVGWHDELEELPKRLIEIPLELDIPSTIGSISG